MTLFEIHPGERVRVRDVSAVSAIGEDPARLRAVGVREGAVLEFVRRLPFGAGVCVLTEGGLEFGLSRALAKGVSVEKERES